MGFIVKCLGFKSKIGLNSVFSLAADWAGGEKLREREESSSEGIWWQKSGAEGKLNCRAGGEEEDDWKWEINHGADGRWASQRWILRLDCVKLFYSWVVVFFEFFAFKHRFNGGEAHHDPETEEATQRSSPDTRQTQKTCTRYPEHQTFVPHKLAFRCFQHLVPGTECCCSVDDVEPLISLSQPFLNSSHLS